MKAKKIADVGEIPVVEKIWAIKKIWIKDKLRYTVIYSNVSRTIVTHGTIEKVLVTNDAKCKTFLNTLGRQFFDRISIIDLSPKAINASSELAEFQKTSTNKKGPR